VTQHSVLAVSTSLALACSLRRFGGEGLDRVDLVLTASGLDAFDQEYQRSREYELDGVRVRVLPLERVIVSKRAAKRAKDLAQIPTLEAALAARKASETEE
jgi:hypothetical protein